MTTPDKGFELGLELPNWSAQADYTRGEANVSGATGHQWTGQVVYVQPRRGVGVRITDVERDRYARLMALPPPIPGDLE